jgi:hypothetical protein
MNEVIVLFKDRVTFKQYISKKYKHFGIHIYKLCNMTSYTYNMSIYFGKDRQNATRTMTAVCVTVRSMTRRVEGLGLLLSRFIL